MITGQLYPILRRVSIKGFAGSTGAARLWLLMASNRSATIGLTSIGDVIKRGLTRGDLFMVRGYLAILMAAVLWGGIGPIAKLAFSQGVSPLEVAFWRATLTWICFGIHAAVKGEVTVARREIGSILLFGLTGVTCFYGSYQLAVDRGGAALASVLLYTAPAWVVVLASVFLKETITFVQLIGLTLIIAGVWMVAR